MLTIMSDFCFMVNFNFLINKFSAVCDRPTDRPTHELCSGQQNVNVSKTTMHRDMNGYVVSLAGLS